jgi:hypothetical protein
MLESPAFRVLSRGAHQFLARLEIELAHHGGNENGRLPVTYQDLVRYGMSRNQIAAAMREAEALGFAECMRRGRGGNADSRSPSLWRITYLHDRNSRANPPTHEWKKIKTLEEARRIAREARADKDERAVMFGRRRASRRRKTENRSTKVRSVSVSVSNTGTPNPPILVSNTTDPGRKLRPLSISRVGGRAARAGRLASDTAIAPRISRPGRFAVVSLLAPWLRWRGRPLISLSASLTTCLATPELC